MVTWWFVRRTDTGDYLIQGNGSSWWDRPELCFGEAKHPRIFETKRGAVSWISQWCKGRAEMIRHDTFSSQKPLGSNQKLDKNGMFIWTPVPGRSKSDWKIVSVNVLLP